MFKKSKRNFSQRIRRTESDEDEEEQQKNVKEDSSTIKSKKISFEKSDDDSLDTKLPENEKAGFKSNKILSFNDDEESDDVFKVKKSNQSRRMEKRKKSKFIFKDEQKNVDKVEMKPEGKSYEESSNNAHDVEMEEIICPESDEDEHDNDDLPRFSFRSKALDNVHSALIKGVIPDSSVITKLKEQRQKMAQKEYIALADDDEDVEEALKEAERMKLDDKFDFSEGSDIEDDNNDTRRIHLGKIDYADSQRNKAKEILEQAQKGRFPARNRYQNSDNDDDEDEEDEEDDSENETDRWEREQMEKAMKMKTIKSIEKDHHNLAKLFLDSKSRKSKAKDKNKRTDKKKKKSEDDYNRKSHSSIPPSSSRPFALPEVSKKDPISLLPSYITKDRQELDYDDLNNRRIPIRNQLALELEDNKRMLDRTKLDLEITNKALSDFQDRKKALVEDYNLYRRTKEFVANLCNCINDKFAIFNRINQQVFEIYENAATKQLDDMRQLMKDYHHANETLLQNRDSFKQYYHNVQCQTIFDFYDFGGDSQMKNRIWLNEQVGKLAFAEELFLDQKSRESLKNLRKESDKIFEDTDQEYSSVVNILNSFFDWRRMHSDTYLESFGGEFIAKLLEFHFRIDNIFRNFIDEDIQFDDDILNYDIIKKALQFTDPELDSVIIPNLVDSIVLKRLQKYLPLWNPFCFSQSRRLSNLLKSIITNIPVLLDCSKNLSDILQRIVLRFESTLENESFIPTIDHTLPDPNWNTCEQAIHHFTSTHFQRHRTRLVNIRKNILLFADLIDNDILIQIVRDKLEKKHPYLDL